VILALAVKDVVRVAVNEANGFTALVGALAGVYVTVPVIGVTPFRNCTAPVGAKPMLEVLTVAVRVTDWLGVTVVLFAVTAMLVPA